MRGDRFKKSLGEEYLRQPAEVYVGGRLRMGPSGGAGQAEEIREIPYFEIQFHTCVFECCVSVQPILGLESASNDHTVALSRTPRTQGAPCCPVRLPARGQVRLRGWRLED